jgi:hypothetical protein
MMTDLPLRTVGLFSSGFVQIPEGFNACALEICGCRSKVLHWLSITEKVTFFYLQFFAKLK